MVDMLFYHHPYGPSSLTNGVGLITPLLRDVDKTGLLSINASMKDLATRSKAGKLLPEEYAVGIVIDNH